MRDRGVCLWDDRSVVMVARLSPGAISESSPSNLPANEPS
jgi:hypothetical protein